MVIDAFVGHVPHDDPVGHEHPAMPVLQYNINGSMEFLFRRGHKVQLVALFDTSSTFQEAHSAAIVPVAAALESASGHLTRAALVGCGVRPPAPTAGSMVGTVVPLGGHHRMVGVASISCPCPCRAEADGCSTLGIIRRLIAPETRPCRRGRCVRCSPKAASMRLPHAEVESCCCPAHHTSRCC